MSGYFVTPGHKAGRIPRDPALTAAPAPARGLGALDQWVGDPLL